jgi:hypothetical protein
VPGDCAIEVEGEFEWDTGVRNQAGAGSDARWEIGIGVEGGLEVEVALDECALGAIGLEELGLNFQGYSGGGLGEGGFEIGEVGVGGIGGGTEGGGPAVVEVGLVEDEGEFITEAEFGCAEEVAGSLSEGGIRDEGATGEEDGGGDNEEGSCEQEQGELSVARLARGSWVSFHCR